MIAIRKRLVASGFALVIGAVAATTTVHGGVAHASEIKYVVNNIPITSYDIQRRVAFFKLQRRNGDSKQAAQEMIDQAIRTAEIKRAGVRITDDQVDAAYARFAASNKLKPEQMDQILNQTGVTKAHFKDFIRAQMGWSQALQAKYRATGTLSDQDVVQRMLQKGGDKPRATEYMLQQIVFVVPAAERGALLGKRKREAEALRQRFSGCDRTREFAKGLVDVTVRDLGRILAPELPPDWADLIKSTKAGSATSVRETERGIEFIGICSSKEVSDDRVARMVFQSEAAKEGGEAEEFSKKYMAELKKKARIIER
ncbi:MAG TPA: SurA N-terminal domain-containing protein [Rhizobiaceae bacterium]|nr:SurA N-terminal domain-containing protein [Rhizobiaceae bacterium]